MGHFSTGSSSCELSFEVAERKFGPDLDLQAAPVPVVPGRRGMEDQVAIQFQLGDTPQIFLENVGLDFDLMLVAGVLIMTPATALKVGAGWINPLSRGLQDFLGARPGEPRLFFGQRRFNRFSRQNERNEGRFTVTICIGGQAGQSIAAVDEFFDGKLQ